MPVGNGHIGCMIRNHPFEDILSINDDTLWSGYPHDYTKKDFRKNMAEVRRLMIDDERVQAEKIVETTLTNRFTQAYMPFGDICIKSKAGKVGAYRRELRMEEGVAYSEYVKDGNYVKTQTFVSYPDDVLVHCIATDAPTGFELSYNSPLKHEVAFDKEGFCVKGIAPSDLVIADVGDFYSSENSINYDEIKKSTVIEARAQFICDGEIVVLPDRVLLRNATTIQVVFACATTFSKGRNCKQYARKRAIHASKKKFADLLKTHIDDHSALFNRVEIDTGGTENTAGEERYARMKLGVVDNADISLLFNYGRYLLIGSSRAGTQAANLQGIWNQDLIPPWWCGYTLNINLQMNYWLADRTNLSECFEPFTGYVKRLCQEGRKTARKDYGTKGSVAHHQSDIWAHSTPVGYDICTIPSSARWMMWNMALPWLCIQMANHYLYTKDKSFLQKDLMPVMKNAADFLIENFSEINGCIYNIPSTSPENMYIDEKGNDLAICNISAMDIGILREFFGVYAHLSRLVGDERTAEKSQVVASKIAGYRISQRGELLEWDREFTEPELGHRHFSMLFGVYPCSHLLEGSYKDAAKKALDKRLDNGSGQTGWSAVWAIALLARFGESKTVYDIIGKLMVENIHENMFGGHPPNLFQIDANFGFPAAICELILQEYGGVIKLLPALPKSMENGSIRGLKIYSGHTVSLKWENSKVTSFEILAAANDEVIIDADYLYCDDAKCTVQENGLRIELESGICYKFHRK